MINNDEYVRALELALKDACDALGGSDECVIIHLNPEAFNIASRKCTQFRFCSDCWEYNLLNQAAERVGEEND